VLQPGAFNGLIPILLSATVPQHSPIWTWRIPLFSVASEPPPRSLFLTAMNNRKQLPRRPNAGLLWRRTALDSLGMLHFASRLQLVQKRGKMGCIDHCQYLSIAIKVFSIYDQHTHYNHIMMRPDADAFTRRGWFSLPCSILLHLPRHVHTL
jgi:hypothetical protein